MLLPKIPIWLPDKVEEGSLLNRNLLVVLLLLCGGHSDGIISSSEYKYQYPKEGTWKSLLKEKIQTVEESMSELLKKRDEVIKKRDEELKESGEVIKKRDEEIKILKRQLDEAAQVSAKV